MQRIPVDQAIIECQSRLRHEQDKLVELVELREKHGRSFAIQRTNSDLFLELINDHNSSLTGVARTMLLQEAARILEHTEEVIEQHKNSIVNGNYIIACARQLVEIFTFNSKR